MDEALTWKPNGQKGFAAFSEKHIYNVRPAGSKFNVSVSDRETMVGLGYSRHDTIEDAMRIAELHVSL